MIAIIEGRHPIVPWPSMATFQHCDRSHFFVIGKQRDPRREHIRRLTGFPIRRVHVPANGAFCALTRWLADQLIVKQSDGVAGGKGRKHAAKVGTAYQFPKFPALQGYIVADSDAVAIAGPPIEVTARNRQRPVTFTRIISFDAEQGFFQQLLWNDLGAGDKSPGDVGLNIRDRGEAVRRHIFAC